MLQVTAPCIAEEHEPGRASVRERYGRTAKPKVSLVGQGDQQYFNRRQKTKRFASALPSEELESCSTIHLNRALKAAQFWIQQIPFQICVYSVPTRPMWAILCFLQAWVRPQRPGSLRVSAQYLSCSVPKNELFWTDTDGRMTIWGRALCWRFTRWRSWCNKRNLGWTCPGQVKKLRGLAIL